jgi:hypothetical protein
MDATLISTRMLRHIRVMKAYSSKGKKGPRLWILGAYKPRGKGISIEDRLLVFKRESEPELYVRWCVFEDPIFQE